MSDRVTAAFPDHFSAVAGAYAAFRPVLPSAVVDLIADAAPGLDHAADAGCGSGQFSRPLARRFERVTAYDPSAEQIAEAAPHPRVAYHVASAEAAPLADRSVEAMVAAQAAHWFDHDRFHAEARRILKPGGVIACVTYRRIEPEGAVGEAFRKVYDVHIRPHWPAERAYVEDGYASLPFPFEEIAVPAMAHGEGWDKARLLGYVSTWSAVTRARAAGRDPLSLLERALEEAWPKGAETIAVRWPVAMRLGRHGGAR